jgi:hypothetical protein
MRLWSFDRWTDDTPIVKHARAAVRNGFAVVFLRPGGKEPLCPLTARERKKAGPKHACGVAHASTVESWVVRKAKLMEQEHGQINLGIAAHASGVVVIDADTPEQVESVAELMRQLGEDAAVLAEQPTVKTPGSKRDGVWVHEQGTHWYFNRPEGLVLPEYPGQMGLPGGAVMRWGNSYTLVPPSVRAEGQYISLAEYIADIPLGLVALIRQHEQAAIDRVVDLLSRFHDDGIVEWSLRTPWHTLLEPDGWMFTGKLDRQCGCPVWRRPGDDASTDRSAIAHEDDCTRLPNYEGHGALYVFSDNPPGLLAEAVASGQRTFTKLQYVALTLYDGDESATKVGLGLEPDYGAWTEDPANVTSGSDPRAQNSVSDCQEPSGQPSDQGERPEEANGQGSGGENRLAVGAERLSAITGFPLVHSKQVIGKELERREAGKILDELDPDGRDGTSWVPLLSLASTLDTVHELVDADDGVLVRDDGETLFPKGKLHILFGQSEAGKSWLCLEILRQVCQRGGRAAYMDLEDNDKAFARRLAIDMRVTAAAQWAREGRLLYSRPEEAPTMATAEMLMARNLDVIVVDAMSEIMATVRDGTAAPGVVTRRIMRIFRALAETGPSVIVIAHASEKVTSPETAMGPSELKQSITGQEVLVYNEQPLGPGMNGTSAIYVTKDRTGASADGISVARHGSRAYRRLWGRFSMVQVTGMTPELVEYTRTALTVVGAEQPEEKDDDDGPSKLELAMAAVLTWFEENKGVASVARVIDDLSDELHIADRTARRAIDRLIDAGDIHVSGEITPPTGGRPSPVIKLGPAPEEET